MESSIVEALLEYGSMGMFAAFLVWQHLSMQKRFDSLVERFQEQLAKITEKAEANEEKLRGRYDSVIKQYQDDKTTFRVDVASQIGEAIRQIEKMPFDSLQIQIEAIALNQRNSQLILEKGMELMNKMQEDAKLKAMARKLSEKDA